MSGNAASAAFINQQEPTFNLLSEDNRLSLAGIEYERKIDKIAPRFEGEFVNLEPTVGYRLCQLMSTGEI